MLHHNTCSDYSHSSDINFLKITQQRENQIENQRFEMFVNYMRLTQELKNDNLLIHKFSSCLFLNIFFVNALIVLHLPGTE